MTYPIITGGNAFPTHEQELLLRAALLKGEPALQAWQGWKARVNLEGKLDVGSYRLLPLLYHNLQSLGVDDPIVSKFKGIYRKAWYQNQMLFRTVADVLRLLHADGIETVILKGAALTLLYYKEYGLRPMNDFDVLVPTSKRRAAIDSLTQAGWKPKFRPIEKLTDAVLDVEKSWTFTDAQQREFDLHWHLMIECRYPHADDDFWTDAIPVQVADVATRALSHTDQLLHVCVHGAAWNAVPPLRWIADAMVILDASDSEVEWTRLVAHAENRRLTLRLRHALTYLRDSFGVAIPAYVLIEMGEVRVSDAERKLYNAVTTKPTWLGGLPVYWSRYLFDLELTDKKNRGQEAIGFFGYLRRLHGMDLLQMLRWAMSRTIFRIGRAVRGLDQGLG
jgi:hypothetical protein